jgi:hypothetical protein
MKAHRNFAILFALALAVTALSVGSAFAQMNTPEARGTFTLPFEAHWGTATLPAGKYTFAEGYTKVGEDMIQVTGEAKGSPRAVVMAQSHGPSTSADTSELVCIREGKTGTVRALVLTSIGKTIYFSMPKNEQLLAQSGNMKSRKLQAEAPELIQRIRVEASGR